mgnify:CR=1 FL=1
MAHDEDRVATPASSATTAAAAARPAAAPAQTAVPAPAAKSTAGMRDLLANERTLLAWVRTALAFMAFGVALERFSVFIKVTGLGTGGDRAQLEELMRGAQISDVMGMALIALGGVIAAIGGARTRRWSERAEPVPGGAPGPLGLQVATGLTVALSAALLLWMLLT